VSEPATAWVETIALAARMRLDASRLMRKLQPLVAQGWLNIGPGEDPPSRSVTLTDAGGAK